MRARDLAVGALAVLLLTAPLAPTVSRAASGDEGAESKTGIALAIACGLSARAALIQPVPWAGVAIMACLGFLIDAATEPDTPNGGDGKP